MRAVFCNKIPSTRWPIDPLLPARFARSSCGGSPSAKSGAQRLRNFLAQTGTDALIGKLATARTPLTPEGYVFIQGERWKAVLDTGTAQEGDKVRIVGAHGFSLQVRKEAE